MFVFLVYTALLLHFTFACQKTKRKSKTDHSYASSHARFSSRKEAEAISTTPVVRKPPKVETSQRVSIRALPESNNFSPKSLKKRPVCCVQKSPVRFHDLNSSTSFQSKLPKQKLPLDKTRKTTTVTMDDRTIQTDKTQIPTEYLKTAIEEFKEITQSTQKSPAKISSGNTICSKEGCSLITDATTEATQTSQK
ncbi:hypothetical protein M3Y96_00166500 [Aphelenchoides besseyi]|nr:hypothetical protein M3Y96_00166500 [Aphelenchoides besseyi]